MGVERREGREGGVECRARRPSGARVQHWQKTGLCTARVTGVPAGRVGSGKELKFTGRISLTRKDG